MKEAIEEQYDYCVGVVEKYIHYGPAAMARATA